MSEGPGFLVTWLRLRRTVRGWLATRDAQLLHQLARNGPGRGNIVEIGSAYGLSTMVLADGARRAGRDKVYTIDPHSFYGSEAEMRANFDRHGMTNWITAVVSESGPAAKSLKVGPIRLLYIDGLHTYEGARADIKDWVPKVVPGGIVVFDDYFDERPEIGVRAAVDQLLSTGEVAPDLNRADHLVWVEKR